MNDEYEVLLLIQDGSGLISLVRRVVELDPNLEQADILTLDPGETVLFAKPVWIRPDP